MFAATIVVMITCTV